MISGSGGRNRTCGLPVQGRGFLPAETTPECAPRGSNPPVGPGKPAPDRSARDASAIIRVRDRGVEPRSPGRRPGVAPPDQSRGLKAEGEGVEPSRLIAHPGSGRVPSPIGLSFRVLSSGGRNRTCVPPVNSRVPVPARAPPESNDQIVGMAGFEPAISCSQGRRIGQAFLHPESSRSPNKCPAGVEPARPPWRGGRLPLHHGHISRRRIVKEPRAPGGTRTHVAALRVRSPRLWTTSALKLSPSWDPRDLNPHLPG